jgi:hypothetical protein
MDRVIITPSLEGVTTAIVLFVFACMLYPRLVKNKTQFYAAFTCVIVIILLTSLRQMLYNSVGFQVFSGAMIGLLQAGAIVLLFLSAGGLTFKELGGDLARAYEVVRRGEEEKTVIIPITGEMANKRPPIRADADILRQEQELDAQEHKIDLPPTAGWPASKGSPAPPQPPPPPPSPSPAKPTDTSLPLD